MKRILYIIASSRIGGAENFIHMLLKHMDNSKYEKYVVCPAGGYYASKYESLAKKTLFIDPARSFMNPKTILKVAGFIRDNRIDIVHSMLYTSDFCAVAAARISGISPRIVNTINGFNFLVLNNRKELRLKRRAASLLYRMIYAYSDKIIAVAEAVRRDLIGRKGFRVRPEKTITVLAAGMDTSYHDYSPDDVESLHSDYIKKNSIVISAIGTLEEVKDYDTMLAAFSIVNKENSNTVLLIAGEGPERERLENKKSRLGLDGKAFFLGGLERNRRNALLSLTDSFVLSSLSEGCPTALLEAMYFGKPAVATSVGGIPEIIRDGETGFIVEPARPGQFADRILAVTRDDRKRAMMGKKAKEVFDTHFTNSLLIQNYANIYKKL